MSITGASEGIETDDENSTDNTPVPDYDNPEQAAEIRAGLKQKKQEQHEEASKAERDKQAILSAIESETCHYRLGGKRIESTLLTGDEERFLKEAAGDFLGNDDDPEDLSRDEYERYMEIDSRIAEILGTHAVEDVFDTEFFAGLPDVKRETAVADLREGGIEGSRAKN